MKEWHIGRKVLVVILSLFLAFPCSMLFAADAKTHTKVKHKSPEYYIPGFRIILDAQIEDQPDVLLARCYFKAKKAEKFVFVNMTGKGNPGYQAILPAPWVNSESIDYVFVVVNKQKVVTRTQVFTIKEKETEQAATWKEPAEVKEVRLDKVQELAEKYKAVKKDLVEKYKGELPPWQLADDSGTIGVLTEVGKASEAVQGFYDSIVVTEVPASSKYGFLAENLYPASQMAAAGGEGAAASATGASTGGAIQASAPIGRAPIIAALLVAAGAGGMVAAAGDGDDAAPAPGGSGGLTDVTVSQTNITLTVFDDSLVDGDQVDVTLNGVAVLTDHVLIGPPGTTVNVTLNSGANTLVVHADNEGASSPNTAALNISNVTAGDASQNWGLNTGQDATMTISAP
jgi:hypothetical protein